MIGRLTLLTVLTTCALGLAGAMGGESPEENFLEARRQMERGNYKDAADRFISLAADTGIAPQEAVEAIDGAVKSLSRVEPERIEPFLRSAAQNWRGSWRVLTAVAERYPSLPPFVIERDGQLIRYFYWGNNSRNASERDRVERINLMLEAEQLLNNGGGNDEDQPSQADYRHFYKLFADIVASRRLDNNAAWRFTELTDLAKVPDYQDYGEYYRISQLPAPVGEDGLPIMYQLPESWQAAKNDGERWRWLLGRIAATGGKIGQDDADMRFALFLQSQFGVHTLGGQSWSPWDSGRSDGGESEAFSVRTLSDNETIAKLATGIKRFSLPDEFNHISLYRRIMARGGNAAAPAAANLAQVYENRQQYAKALETWQSIPRNRRKSTGATEAISRITGKDGRLEPGPTRPAGEATSISYLFRNGDSVRVTAQRLDERQLLQDIRARLKRPYVDDKENIYAFLSPESIGMLAMEKNGEKYIKETTAEWTVPLNPLADHRSSRAAIQLPFTMPGVYLVTARMEDGNTSRAVVWIADLALIHKAAYDKQYYYLADAAGGEPVRDATISLIGYNRIYDSRTERSVFNYKETAVRTDQDGLAALDTADMVDMSWLAVAETESGSLAFLGFNGVWTDEPAERDAGYAMAYIITDRPVYRPEQRVEFKLWLGKPDYGRNSGPDFANRSIDVEIRNPRGDTVYEKTLTSDNYGGAADFIALDENAMLGIYTINVKQPGRNGENRAAPQSAGFGPIMGGVSFRLEEYRKPEYEVTVSAPDDAIALGDTAQIRVEAKYYFGSPVTDATVKYKITRTGFDNRWLPPWRWDWLYGNGSGWLGYDYDWYPGWNEWGMPRPAPMWLPPRRPSMPELVAEGEGAVDSDGVFRIQLDTLPAKEIFGDEDHQYLISVEVTDASRRTITGSGKVVAARKPYAVTVWADRGYYRTGEPIQANLRAVAPLGNGVQAGGTAVLYRIRYDENSQPVENKVNSWPIATDQDGSAALRLSADAAGQYRLACTLADAQGRKVEGAVLLTVRGEAGEGDFRFTDLELVPDRSEYQPGDQVRLAVNSSNPDGVVLLFPKAERSGARPLVVRLANGTAIVPIPVAASDQPNFFCEAVTVLDGRSVTETRQIFVPPAEKNLAVTITPEKDSFLPGDEAAFTVKVVDADGAPVRGQIAAVIYDRSIEYISGGSNVGDIRSFYWNWKRDYWPRIDSSLNRAGYLVHKEGDRDWQPIGFFGREEADWNDEAVYGNGIVPTAASGRGVRMRSQAPQPEPAPAAALYQSVEVEASVAMDAAPAPKQAMAGGGDGGETGMAEPALRSDFADTALWLPALETDEDGTARFTATMPENLTAWKVRVWAKADQTRVGETETAVETRKNVIIRPQAPRFLTQKDQVILSANLHNYLPRAKSARVELLLEGGLLTPAPGVELVRSVELPANGETRIDWLVSAARPGSATVIMRLLTDEESDAAAITVPVLFHGSRRIESFGGGLNPGQDETTISFTVPSERLAERSRLELNFSPTLASAMLEALPYLLQYPYGCTEQTLNRFLPLATTRSYLNAIGADLAGAGEAAARAEAARTADSQSSAWLDRYGDSASASRSPLVDEDEYNRMIRAGVDRLATMQNPDGGWGWFSGPGEQSWGHTTATVVYGLLTARANGVAVPTPAMRSGLEWLSRYQDGEIEKIRQYETTSGEQGKQHADNLDAFVHMVLVRAGGGNPQAQDILYQDRLELSLTGLAMLGLALEQENAAVMLETVLENLSQFIQRNDDNNTVWLRTPARGWWLWQHDPIETQAWYLKLLARTNPTGDDAAGLAKYLITNRKNASYWRSTRDTGYAIEALAEYAVASGETDPDITVRILYDGDQVMERRINRGNLLQPQRFVLEGAAVESGRHEIRIIRTGEGRLYFSGLLDVFSHEDPIAAAGNDLKVERRFYKLTPEESTASARSASGGAVRTRVEKYNKQRIPSPFDSMEQAGVQLASGDMVEVELTITAANDYEYLVFEDMKAAGLEAVELVSGYANDGSGAYIEYRDDKVALFIRFLPRGVHTVRYRFRAETPGAFSALPTVGGGMYAPELRANSDEMKIRIGEDGVFE